MLHYAQISNKEQAEDKGTKVITKGLFTLIVGCKPAAGNHMARGGIITESCGLLNLLASAG